MRLRHGFLSGLTLAASLAQLPVVHAQPTSAAYIQQAESSMRAGDLFSALRAYGEARRLDPNNARAAAALADILVELGGPHGAAAASGKPPDIGLRSRQAASLVRWGAQTWPTDPAQRFATTDSALQALDALLLEAASLSPPDPGLVTRLKRDKAVALRDRKRWADVLATTAELRASSDGLPAFVRHAEADALLALRRPHDARLAYAEVLAADPQNREATVGRFFAEVESEDFAAAFATVDALAAKGEPSMRFGDAGALQPNVDWLGAQVLAGLARSYADMPAEAWERLHPLANGAPALGYLRAAQGGVAAQRGWPRLAAQEIEIAASLAPADMGVAVGVVDSDMRRREWRRAEKRLDAIAGTYPDEALVRRTQVDLAAYKAPELQIELSHRNEDGNGANAPGRGGDASLMFYTSPLAERWRLAAGATRSTARLPEGDFSRNRAGLGVEGRWPDVTLLAMAWNNNAPVSDPGASTSLRWEPDDHWKLQFEAERFSADTPLRAQVYGIRADAAGASVSYAWHESRSVFVGARALDFTDGNRRHELSAGVASKVIDQPGLDMTLRGGLYASSNSLAGVPYFNPSSDHSVTLSADFEQPLWRVYERSFSHRLVLSAGSYSQSGYASGGIGGVLYEQSVQANPWTSVRYGFDWTRRIYDGLAERAFKAFVRLEHKFK